MSTRHAVTIFGVPIDDYTTDEFIERLEQLIQMPEQALVCPVNADILNQCYSNARLRSFISAADLIQAESAGILTAAKIKGVTLSGKITSNEFIYDLAIAWAEKPFSIYFLGGPAGQAGLAAKKLTTQYPGFKVAGYHQGHLSDADSLEVIKIINKARPSVLMVGFGCPEQERWVEKHRVDLKVPLLWPIGNLTSYVSGIASTAPLWMKHYGLEWLHRLYLEPKRMWRRYILGNPLFLFRVLLERLIKKDLYIP